MDPAPELLATPPETPTDPADRAALLRRWGREAGFDRVGVARLEPSRHGDAFHAWIDRGDHAGMEWLERRIERRLDPARIVPGARSALCVALQYWPLAGSEGTAPEPGGDLWPRVARYARGRDYHDVLGERLEHLEARILEAFPGTASRRYVDTGPVLERELAARAGLGAVGKNTNLLSREGGSYFLLGEILLTLDLEPDEPLADLCGRCTRCLDLCPTGALPEPYRLDANRCISYWTIEHRGDLPEEAREMLGDWVFGCDVCQEVCPWNLRGPEPGDHPELELPPRRAELDLVGLLTLDRSEYVERFRGSPMKRAKLQGLQRNAAVAMGNRGDRQYVDALVAVLADRPATGEETGPDGQPRDPRPMVRRHAAWALGRIATPEARRALVRARDEETDATVRDAVLAALAVVDGEGGGERSRNP